MEKNIDFQGKNPIEMYIDDYDLNSLEKFKIDLFERISSDKKTQNKEGVSGLEILLGVGAAILLLGALTSKKEK